MRTEKFVFFLDILRQSEYIYYDSHSMDLISQEEVINDRD